MTLQYSMKADSVGATISNLSLLLDADLPVKLTIPDNEFIVADLKRIFNISNDRLLVNQSNTLVDPLLTDLGDAGKFFSPYIQAERINVMGKSIPVGKTKRNFIALASCGSNILHNLDSFPKKSFPYNRFYSKEYWTKVVGMIWSAGYEVLSLNSQKITLEEKVYLLNEQCFAVIGYEGGLCHLAHTLKIPSIILPWHLDLNGEYRDHLYYAAQRLHVDPRTWFVESADELLTWNAHNLRTKIRQLEAGQGNSVYMNKGLEFNPAELTIRDPRQLEVNLDPWLTWFEKDFILKYIKPSSIWHAV